MKTSRVILCSECVRARGGSSAVGVEFATPIVAGFCDDCDRGACSCGGRHALPSCPRFRNPAGVVEALRAFRPRPIPDDAPTLRVLEGT